MRQHVQIGVRQFVTQDINAIHRAQNTNTHRRRSHDFTVKLLMFFQPLSITFRWNKNAPFIHAREHKQCRPDQHVQQDSVQDHHTDPLQHQVNRNGVHDAQGGRRQIFLQYQLAETRRVTKPGALLHPVGLSLNIPFRAGERN